MSDVPSNPMDPREPNGPVSPLSGEGVAERFVDHELVDTRASLNRTRIVCVVLTVFTVGYVSYLTSGFRSNLEPNAAATIATGIASQRLDDLEPQFAEYIHEQVPMMIRRAPDEVITRLPEYRKELEQRVDRTLREQAQKGTDQLNKQLDEFLVAHKDAVGELIEHGQDPANAEALGTELDKSLTEYLETTQIGNETIQQKLDHTLTALKQVSARLNKLAANKGLTPSEKKTRHAVAMLMRRIDAAQAAEPNAIKPIDVEGLKQKANATMENVRSTVQSNLPEAPATDTATPATKPATPKKPGV